MTDPTPQTTPTRDEAVREIVAKYLWNLDDVDALCRELASAPAPASGRVDAVQIAEALKPLAAMDAKTEQGHAFDAWADDAVVFDIGKDRKITAGDLRRARSALSPAATPVSEAEPVAWAQVGYSDKLRAYGAFPMRAERDETTGYTEPLYALAKPASSPAGGDVVREAFEVCARIAGGRESDGTVSWPDGHEIAEAIREHADTWIKARLASQSTSAGRVGE